MKRLLAAWCFLVVFSSVQVHAQTGLELVYSEVVAGEGVTAVRPLSDFFSGLRGTPFDTPVFVMGDGARGSEGAEAPPCAAIVAGTHANEIAGVLASYWIIERCRAPEGRLVVVPRANASGATWSLQDARGPWFLELGSRTIRYGTRLSNPAQERLADPGGFVPPQASGNFPALAGQEARNLNRQYPGRQDGNSTAQTAYALTLMLQAEEVRIALDLHEASMTSSLVWSMITRPEHLDAAALAALDIEDETGVSFHLEDSRDEFAGYSHWEWGKLGISAFLVETPNPAQPTDDPTIEQLHNAAAPLAKRVYVHLCAAKALIANAADLLQDAGALRIEGFPSSVEEVGRWLEGTL
ncbi:MAG: succinylglutamate desuccinylase/aspartoacylase family protein [Rectinema sp.]